MSPYPAKPVEDTDVEGKDDEKRGPVKPVVRKERWRMARSGNVEDSPGPTPTPSPCVSAKKRQQEREERRRRDQAEREKAATSSTIILDDYESSSSLSSLDTATMNTTGRAKSEKLIETVAEKKKPGEYGTEVIELSDKNAPSKKKEHRRRVNNPVIPDLETFYKPTYNKNEKLKAMENINDAIGRETFTK